MIAGYIVVSDLYFPIVALAKWQHPTNLLHTKTIDSTYTHIHTLYVCMCWTLIVYSMCSISPEGGLVHLTVVEEILTSSFEASEAILLASLTTAIATE